MKTKSEKTRSFRHPSVHRYGRGQRFDVTPVQPQQARGVVGEKDFEQMQAAYARGDMGGGHGDTDSEADGRSGGSSVPSEPGMDTTVDYANGRDEIPEAENEGPDKSPKEMAEDMIEDIDTLEYLIFEFLNNLKGSIQAIYDKL